MAQTSGSARGAAACLSVRRSGGHAVGAPATALALCLILVAGPRAQAQSPTLGPSVPTWGPDLQANVLTASRPALLIDGHTLYVGGAFDQVGPPTGSFATVSASDASAVRAATAPVRPVTALAPDGSGGWYVAADPDFRLSASPTIDHFLANGARDLFWTRPTISGVIRDLDVHAGRLFVGGIFDRVNGAERQGLAVLDGMTGALLPWDAQLTETLGRYYHANVRSLAVAGGRIYASGTFTHAAGVARDSLAVFDATTAAVLPYYTLPAGPFTATSSRIYVGTGAFDLDLNPIPGYSQPWELSEPFAASDSAFYATEVILGIPRVVAVDPATGARLPFTPVTFSATAVASAGGGPGALAVSGGRLYIGGAYSAVNGAPRFNLSAVDATTGALLPWAPVVGRNVAHVAVHGDAVAAGGAFNTAGGQPKRNLAAIDLRTGLPAAGAPDIPFPVSAMLRLGDVVVVAGAPPAGGGLAALAFSLSSGALLPWGLESYGAITTLATDGRHVFFGGEFTAIAGLPRRHLAAFDLSTLSFTAWTPAPDAPVAAVAASAGTLFVSSPYRGSGDAGKQHVIAYDVASGARLPFSPSAPNIRGFGFYGHRVLLGGNASFDGVTWVELPWVDRASGDLVPPVASVDLTAGVTDVFQRGQSIYVAASPWATGPLAVYVVDAPSGVIATLETGYADFNPSRIVTSPEYVALAGRFTAAPGTPSRGLAVFQSPRPGPPQGMTASVVGSTITLGWSPGTPPVATSFLVEAGTSAGASDVGVFSVGASTRATGGLPPGTYFTRVRGVSEGVAGAPSSEVIVTTPASTTAPGPPGVLTASVTGRTVAFSWFAASGNATTYILEAGTAPGLANLVAFPTGTLDTALATPAPPGAYYVRVRAANAFGVSGPSNEVFVVVP